MTSANQSEKPMMDQHGDLRARVVALENWRNQREVDSARHDEKWKNLEETLTSKFDAVEKQMNGFSDTLKWLNRVILTGIAMGIVSFLINGGFSMINRMTN